MVELIIKQSGTAQTPILSLLTMNILFTAEDSAGIAASPTVDAPTTNLTAEDSDGATISPAFNAASAAWS